MHVYLEGGSNLIPYFPFFLDELFLMANQFEVHTATTELLTWFTLPGFEPATLVSPEYQHCIVLYHVFIYIVECRSMSCDTRSENRSLKDYSDCLPIDCCITFITNCLVLLYFSFFPNHYFSPCVKVLFLQSNQIM